MDNNKTIMSANSNEQETLFTQFCQAISCLVQSSSALSKDKYQKKIQLIEEDKTMSTQEKLNLLDDNYLTMSREADRIFLKDVVVSMSIIGVMVLCNKYSKHN